MKFQTRELIKNIEQNLQNSYSLPIFRGYKAINKRGVEKLITQLYATLPDDVKKARDYLSKHQHNLTTPKKEKIYDTLQDIEIKLSQGFPFAQLLIINIREIESLLKQLQNNLPEEITQAENLDK